MKILITGATGFVGGNLAETLIRKNHEVHCLVRKSSATEKLKALGAILCYGDITKPSSLLQAVKSMDYIYHLAIVNRPKTISAYYLVNYQGTKNLLDAVSVSNPGLKKLIYVSSLSAAGYSSEGHPCLETDQAHPVSHYGKSKLRAEEAVQTFARKLPVVILRPPTIYGEGNLFFNYLFSCLKSGVKPFWHGYTSLCYIKDFIEGAIEAALNPQASSELFYICDERVYTWKYIIDCIAMRTQSKARAIFIPHATFCAFSKVLPFFTGIIKKPYLSTKCLEMQYPSWTCSPEKIKKVLHFSTKFTLEAGLNDWLS